MQLTRVSAKLFQPNVNANLWSQATLAIARVVIGVMMVHNGQDKLADIESFARAYVEYCSSMIMGVSQDDARLGLGGLLS